MPRTMTVRNFPMFVWCAVLVALLAEAGRSAPKGRLTGTLVTAGQGGDHGVEGDQDRHLGAHRGPRMRQPSPAAGPLPAAQAGLDRLVRGVVRLGPRVVCSLPSIWPGRTRCRA
jgi:hypothetical protein